MSDIPSITEVEKMEDINPNNVQIVIKTVSNDGIIIRDTKQLTDKGEEIKTTEYFLEVDEEGTDTVDGHENTEYITIENDDESEEGQFVAVDVSNNGELILQDKDVILIDELCRICADESDRFIPIFTGEGLEHNLSNKIHSYLPLKVSENDNLPLQICYNCAATLLAWHEMYRGCLNAQERLENLQTKFNLKGQDQYYNNSIIEDENNDNVLEVKNTNSEEIQDEIKDEQNIETMQIVNIADSDRSAVASTSNKTQETSNQKYMYMCGLCDEFYNEELELIRHLKKDHDAAESFKSINPVRYECNVCRKSYVQKINLISHMRIHKKEMPGEAGIVEKSKIFHNKVRMYKCDKCGHLLSHRRTFLRHIRVHANERPITCQECGKGFRIEDDLKRHDDDVHKKIKRFACDICGTAFAAKSTRDAHRRIHTGEKPFPCGICNKTFRSINLLGVHKRVHTDYRPHKCAYCEKAFRDKQKLAAHETIHTGIRPYPCDVCGKAFSAKGEASRHRTVHFEHKPFLCSECGLSFRLNRYLLSHMKTHHPEEYEIYRKESDDNRLR